MSCGFFDNLLQDVFMLRLQVADTERDRALRFVLSNDTRVQAVRLLGCDVGFLRIVYRLRGRRVTPGVDWLRRGLRWRLSSRLPIGLCCRLSSRLVCELANGKLRTIELPRLRPIVSVRLRRELWSRPPVRVELSVQRHSRTQPKRDNANEKAKPGSGHSFYRN